MTAPNGPIIVSSTAGSNTAASGLGPSTAIFGTGASTTAASAVADLSADTPDLSGVTSGDIIWIDSSSGIQFNVIASVDDGTDLVTCDVVWANTEGTRNWGIGGKRASLVGSLSLGIDALAGWIIELADAHTESSGTAFVASFDADAGGGARVTLRGEVDAATRPNVSGVNVAQTILVTGTSWTIHGFDITTDGTADRALDVSDKYVQVYDMRLSVAGTASNQRCLYVNADECRAWDCFIDGNDASGSRGIDSNGGARLTIQRCTIKNCADMGVRQAQNEASLNLEGCDIYGCGNGVDIPCGNGNGRVIRNNRVYDSASAGVLINGLDNANRQILIQENVITNSGTYHIDYSPTGASADDADLLGLRIEGNAFFNATSGNLNNLNDHDNVQLTADPFVNAATGDFNINDTAGGGTVLRAITKTMPI